MTNTATLVKSYPANEVGAVWKLYRLDPPVNYITAGGIYSSTEHVIVSAMSAPFSWPETYIFSADEEGNVISYLELPGSFQGGLDHEAALEGAGYTINDEEDGL